VRDIITEINEKLDEIERTEGVRVLHAVESGSRAWGFASLDSDYDVRFVYVRPKEDYLRLDEPRDVIEWQLDEVLDINGWDLIKAVFF
jgi:predicted nucleotidyltransferase